MTGADDAVGHPDAPARPGTAEQGSTASPNGAPDHGEAASHDGSASHTALRGEQAKRSTAAEPAASHATSAEHDGRATHSAEAEHDGATEHSDTTEQGRATEHSDMAERGNAIGHGRIAEQNDTTEHGVPAKRGRATEHAATTEQGGAADHAIPTEHAIPTDHAIPTEQNGAGERGDADRGGSGGSGGSEHGIDARGTLRPVLWSQSSPRVGMLEAVPHWPVAAGRLHLALAVVARTPRGSVGMYHVAHHQVGELSFDELMAEACEGLAGGLDVHSADDGQLFTLTGTLVSAAVCLPVFYRRLATLTNATRLIVGLPGPDEIRVAAAGSPAEATVRQAVRDSEHPVTELVPCVLAIEGDHLEVLFERG
jgi:hypothetical protein